MSVGEIAATPTSSFTLLPFGLVTWVNNVLQLELVCGRPGAAGPLPRATRDLAPLRSGSAGEPGLVPARAAAAAGIGPLITIADMTAATTRDHRTRFPGMANPLPNNQT